MKFKKILFMLLLTIFFINVGYSVTYLNSCGKSSGWVNGETYILNFTSTDLTETSFKTGTTAYDQGYGCFKLDTEYDDIRFIGNGEPILFNAVSTLSNSFYRTGFIISGVTRQDNITFENLTINVDRDSFNTYANSVGLTVNFLTTGYNSGIVVEDWTKFNNVTLTEFDWIIYDRKTTSGWYSRTNSTNSIFIYNNAFDYTNYGSGSTQHRFYNSVLIGNELTDDKRGTFIINDSVIGLISDNLTGSYSTTSVIEDSILTGTTGTDSDNDGVYDVDVIPSGRVAGYYQGLRFYKDLFGKRFLLDTSVESEPIFYSAILPNVFVTRERLGLTTLLQTSSSGTIDTYPAFYLYENFDGLRLAGGVNYTNTFGQYTQSQDTNTNNFTSSADYKGLISLFGNNIYISKLIFTKFYNNNNAQIISDLTGQLRNNLNIYDNKFYKFDDNFKFLKSEFITLNANNLKIYNNLFESGTSFSNGYDYLRITGTNPNSNEVYLNRFITSTDDESIVFTSNADTLFYNNYIGENVTLCDTCIGLNATPIVPYFHTDGKTYYFEIGNYYEDNTGCVDLDTDGFCDSPYISGDYTDKKPLLAYPFLYTNYLSSASSVVEPHDWTINLTGVIDSQTFNLNASTDSLNFGFIHNSTYPDLVCDYFIDNSQLVNETITDTPANIDQVIPLSNWVAKNYTYRVECFNDFEYKQSSEITFTVNIGTVTPGEEPGTTPEDVTGIFSGGVGLFTGNQDDDSESFIQFLKIFETPIGYGIILGSIFVVMVLVVLIFAYIRFSVIGGSK